LREHFGGGALMNFKNPGPDSFKRNAFAAAQIFNDYGDFIKKVIRSQIQDEDQAEDLFQDFFLSLISNPLPGDIKNTEAYLYRAISNDIANAIHLTKKYENCIYEYAELCNYLRSQKTPEKIVQDAEEKNRVFELVDKQLPRTEAQAVRFQYRDGLDAKEMAEKMSVKNKTIRGYVSDGLSRIRRLLKDISAREAK
jgi:RNA polymerase sigma factor (sigma-70 family)